MAITSRKHATPAFTPMNTLLAAMLLPMAATGHAADAAPAAASATAAAAAPATMQEVRVEGAKENDFKADRAASAKYSELLVNTPQTITVIKRELIEQQGAATLTEALANTPGVGAFFLGENGNTNTGDAIFMRGFDASSSIYVDGVRDMGSISRDVFNVEQIDILKGPAGTDSGRGAPTGSINLSSKQAHMQDAYSGRVTFGSAEQKRATADVNQVISAEKGIAFRFNALAQDSGKPGRDVVKNKRWAIAPTVAFGIGSPTRLTLSYLHVDQDNVPDGGVPTIGLPGYTSPGTAAAPRPELNTAAMVNPKGFYGSSSDYDKVKADMATVRVDHDFSPTVKLQNTSRFGKTDQDYLLTAFMGTAANLVTRANNNTGAVLDPSAWLLKRTTRTIKDQRNEILTNQTNLTAEFDAAGMKHTAIAGLEFTNEKQVSYSYLAASLGTLADTPLYNPDSSIKPVGLNPVRNGAMTDGSTNTQSLYLFDTAKLGEQWMFSGGIRADHFRTTYNAITLSTAAANPTLPVGTLLPANMNLSDTLVNGKLSALYKPTPDSSVYATVATSKQPPGGSNFSLSASASSAANPKFDPQETTTQEIGGKWDLLKQKLALTGAIYRTTVKNEVEQDPIDLQYYQTGKKRVEGVEIGVTGELAKNWLISAGYAHMKTEVLAGKTITANGQNQLTYTPKDSFTAWTSYTLPFGLKVGGGLRYSGKLLRGTDGAVGTPAYADGYWVANAMAAYTVNKNVDLQLNVNNITGEEYVAAINKSGYRYTPGVPRSASLTANIRF
ncbi:catecholate siderophore receptor Fiu [Pseudoduganella aquatica]|uniref:Catecholate siderophore receptor Fiu n=1 Tax=Pseudoduganella aquatica TaxID=2660641 RepID=A0A7X4H998_9BURK|nr:catecholate siderophore receptor Fiu [Pseudoduganella aquatica]MYN06623.1 catecholate siderophore receptor Fiu [Pseudoduganella aquatica]